MHFSKNLESGTAQTCLAMLASVAWACLLQAWQRACCRQAQTACNRFPMCLGRASTRGCLTFSDCLTINHPYGNGGSGPGVSCKFPFNYGGTTYTKCSCMSYCEYDLFICATEIDQDGNMVNYGFCGPNCPK